MALAALISAYKLAEEEAEGLRATLPLAGRALLEYQARLASYAGAEHILVLVERVPVALTMAVDRLRRDGLRVDIARDAADAADRIHPEERLLVIGDGCIAAPAQAERMAEARPPTLLTVPDDDGHAMFERIDASARWGGMMLIDGALLRDTVAMLGDWDIESTLLRRAVQGEAERLDATTVGGDGAPLLADAAARLDGFDRTMLAGVRPRGRDWVWRYVFPPIEGLVASPLLRRGVDSVWFAVAGVTAAIVAGIFFAADLRMAGEGALLLSGPIAALAERLAGARLAPLRWAQAFLAARAGVSLLALLALANGLASEAGWGVWLIALAIPLTMAALWNERRILRQLPGDPAPLWIASLDGLIWALLPFALIGGWLLGMVALAAYAMLSFATVQRAVAERIVPRAP